MVEEETNVAHTFAHENAQPEMSHSNPTAQEVDRSVESVKPLTEEEQLRLVPFIEWMETVDLDSKLERIIIIIDIHQNRLDKVNDMASEETDTRTKG
jgi:hypothetical protein